MNQLWLLLHTWRQLSAIWGQVSKGICASTAANFTRENTVWRFTFVLTQVSFARVNLFSNTFKIFHWNLTQKPVSLLLIFTYFPRRLGFKPLKCRHCFRAFGDPSNLNKHIRLHAQHGDHTIPNSANAYKCHICSKILHKRRDLQRHMQLKHSTTNGHHNSPLSSVDESSMTLLSPSSSSSDEETTE